MWRPDRTVIGPERAGPGDIDALNRVFADAFTDRYRRDGLTGVRVPFLNPLIWQFALADAGDGAMLWRDSRGDVIAFNIVHRSGAEGWMGPLAVRTDRQGSGLGRRIVEAGIQHLAQREVRTIGLETMPRTIENIGFYSRLGFVPGHLTVTLQRDRTSAEASGGARLGLLEGEERAAAIRECRVLSDRLSPGVDFTAELALTLEHGVGDVSLLRSAEGTLEGFALWHTAPLALGRPREELRLLKLGANDTATARRVIAVVEREAANAGLSRMTLRCQTSHAELYTRLVGDGFRVLWTDLRMTLAGKGEVHQEGVLLSNWEI